jgi:hypothetical protein
MLRIVQSHVLKAKRCADIDDKGIEKLSLYASDIALALTSRHYRRSAHQMGIGSRQIGGWSLRRSQARCKQFIKVQRVNRDIFGISRGLHIVRTWRPVDVQLKPT